MSPDNHLGHSGARGHVFGPSAPPCVTDGRLAASGWLQAVLKSPAPGLFGATKAFIICFALISLSFRNTIPYCYRRSIWYMAQSSPTSVCLGYEDPAVCSHHLLSSNVGITELCRSLSATGTLCHFIYGYGFVSVSRPSQANESKYR